jgi:murein DD-endopeptidase MepM/ murein hydrolase activator NlpD
MISRCWLGIAIASLGGCLATATDGDPDQVVEAATAAIANDSADAIRALRVANGATEAALVDGARLAPGAAHDVVARRTGPHGVDGTADDQPFYTLAELAATGIDAATVDLLAAYGRAHRELFGPLLQIDALPAELAADPDIAGMLAGMAADSSLMIDDDPATMLSSEWELSALFAHHFVETTAARVAKLRGYVFDRDVRSGPFLDVVTIDRVRFGEAEPSWALGALLRRTAADPHHTVGRIYGSELAAALADADFVARFPGIAFIEDQYLSIWNAQVATPAPSDLPPELARTRALLQRRGVDVFTAPYPADRAMPDVVAAAPPVAMPFAAGTEITCMQGNNSMAASSSHAPDQLRYALDLDAPFATTLIATVSGTAYVYDHGRPNSFDNYGFGNILLIDLHNGYALFHAHLSSFAVVNGQTVTAGQVVGAVGVTGAAGAEPHVHLQVVRLFQTPDPAHEEYQSDTPAQGHVPPFGGPEPFVLRAIDLTAGDRSARAIPSTAIVGGESGWLPGAAHVYRTP